MRNPFTPSFGQVPPLMAGREVILADMQRAFEEGPGDPNLCTIFTGARGTGKTALLLDLSLEAEQRGWIAVNATAIPGMLEDVLEQALRKGAHLLEKQGSVRLTGVTFARALGLQWEYAAAAPGNWRSRMTDVLEKLHEHGVGLLVTVDEVDPELDEMIELSAVYQHFVGERRKVSLLMAGLPHKVSRLLGHQTVSFLRRACQHRLNAVSDADVRRALRGTVELSEKAIGDKALDAAVSSIGGFPFMMQLVGFRFWQAAGDERTVSLEHVQQGVERAREDMSERVLRPTLDELSAADLEFLVAMLADDRVSKASELMERLGKSSGHVSTYKRRLLEHGVIDASPRGTFSFALPMLREYLPVYLEESL